MEDNEVNDWFKNQNKKHILNKTQFYKELEEIIDESNLFLKKKWIHEQTDKNKNYSNKFNKIFYNNNRGFKLVDESKLEKYKYTDINSSLIINFSEGYIEGFEIQVLSKGLRIEEQETMISAIFGIGKKKLNCSYLLEHFCYPFDESSKIRHNKNYKFDDFIILCESLLKNDSNIINQQELNLLKKLNEIISIRLNNLENETNSSFDKINVMLLEFDKDENGIVDVLEGTDDFLVLLKKHQAKIIEIDRIYVQNFIKISNYLKSKKENIQIIFTRIKESLDDSIYVADINSIERDLDTLRDINHSLELILFHSINMITSLIENDMITFFEIYETLDKLNLFNSNWENEVSKKLTNIEEGISNILITIQKMENNIIKEISNLSYITEDSIKALNNSVTKELQSIDSSIKFNNLLTGIQTYQTYRINKQTKNLNN